MVRNYVFVESGMVKGCGSSRWLTRASREVAFYKDSMVVVGAGGSLFATSGARTSCRCFQFYQPGDLDIDPDSLDIAADTLKLETRDRPPMASSSL